MDKNAVADATKYLKSLKRVLSVFEGEKYPEDVLLLPKAIDVIVDNNNNIQTTEFDRGKDIKARDLLRIISIEDANNLKFKETNVLSPSVYVHTLQDKPWHITTQGFLVTHISSKTKQYIKNESLKLEKHYGKHAMDSFWLTCSLPLDLVSSKDLVCIFNRRISGWDGSTDRPVIELLGAGGHLQAVWNSELNAFVNRTFEDNLIKEFDEEIGLNISRKDIRCIGGFKNSKTHELVVFSCIYINEDKIPDIQTYALNNHEEDTDGIYLGTFNETINYYKKDPSFFAGGKEAAKTNFPNNDFIIRKIYEMFSVNK